MNVWEESTFAELKEEAERPGPLAHFVDRLPLVCLRPYS